MVMKKNTKNTKSKPKREYIKITEAVGSAAYLVNGDIWLRSGKEQDWAPGVTINIGETEALSDWMRHITLEDVTVCVGTLKGSDGKEYPELIVRGGDTEEVPF